MHHSLKRPADIIAEKLHGKVKSMPRFRHNAPKIFKHRHFHMNDLQPSDFFSSRFPTSLAYEIQQLPENARREFMFAYNEEKKDVGIAYVLHFLFGAHYAYQGKWGKQILFWLTFYGFFGVGWVINIFRIPGSIRKQNRQIAERILRSVYRRNSFQTQNPPVNAVDYIAKRARLTEHSLKNVRPRNVKPNYDPVALTVENLAKGFMVDYNFKTWDVISEIQFDWQSGDSDRCFKLASDTKTMIVNLRKDSGHLDAVHFEPVSLFAIDPKLEAEIKMRNKPGNVIYYKDDTYYRETSKNGLFFVLNIASPAKKVAVWEYFDESRNQLIRIENYGKEGIKSFIGKIVSPLDFSEILPIKSEG